jgi:signal transduction histidine kinase/ligand-binding sensor domain-containing protein
LWIGTRDGLYRRGENSFTRWGRAEGLPSEGVKTLYIDAQGIVWVGTREGLGYYRGGKLSVLTTRDGLIDNNIETIYGCRDGSILIGTLNGLSRWQNGKFTSFTIADGLPSNRVGALYEDREGSVWVATTGGLARLREGKFTAYTANDGLSSNIVLSLYEDWEGSLWVGTESGGLNVLKDKKFTTLTKKEGLTADLVRAIYQDRRGQVWIGTHEGGLNLYRDGKFTAYTANDGLSSNIVLSICETRDGGLWVGTPDGLNLWRGGKFTTYTLTNGLPNDFIRSLYEDRAGRLWIGTRGGLSRYENGEFTNYTTLDGLPNDYVGTIYEDRAGALWIGTLSGLSRFQNNQFTNFTTRDGLSSNVVTSIMEDETGALWIGTNGGGLVRLQDGKFTAFTTKDGLYNDNIFRVLEDAGGDFWMSCSKGIFRVSRRQLEDYAAGRASAITPVVYGTADGMKTSECSSGGHPADWKTADGKLWFSTIKGVAVIDPAHIKLNEQAPPIVMQAVTVDDKELNPMTAANLAPGKARFDFHYAGLSFLAPQKVAYRYKLEGFDREWIDAGPRRAAFYTNIPPGRYTFKVMARNNDGVWGPETVAYAFTLRPHFYQTYWFYAFCAAALACAGWALYRMRVRRMEAQFGAVLAERNRLAREIHDTLAQGFAGTSVQLELVARMLSVSSDKAQAHLDQARILVRNSLAEARRSIWDLRSQALESGGLPTALAETAKQLTSGTPTLAQVQVNGAYRELPSKIENNLLRIGQEAITNAVKHAAANHLRIELRFDAKQVRLSVRDDGRGFDQERRAPASPTNGHFGLMGMRERAEQINGTLTVRSVPGEGTEIGVAVPVGD